MIVLLRAHGKYSERARLDSNTGTLKKLSALQAFRTRALVIQGEYAAVNTSTMSVYRLNGKLCLCIGNRQFEITEHIRARLTPVKWQQRFQLIQGEDIVLGILSTKPRIDPPLSVDPTPSIEEEDFDFLLFVANIVNDTGRQSRVFIT